MTRVLFLNPGAGLGGAERSLLELIRSLPRDRYLCHLLLPNPGPLEEAARRAGAEVTLDPWPAALRKVGRERGLANRALALLAPLLLVRVLWRSARAARRIGADIVHTNGTKSHMAGWGAALGARARLVWHVRDVMDRGLLRGLLRLLAALLPSAILANSRASARPFEGGWLGRAIAPRLAVVYNGIDLQEFRPVARDPLLASALGLPSGAFVIGALGALAPLKGHIHLIRAMPRLIERIDDARLLLVGEEMYETMGHRGYKEILVAEAERLGVRDRVIFAGRREDVVPLYSLMDVVALPSVRPESFGRVAAEAMACGRAVVASRLGGPEEIVESAEVGMLVPPADPAAIASAIQSLASDPARRERMGRLGREMVARRFTLQRHAAEVCGVYDRLMRSGPSARPDPVKEGTAR